MPIELSIDALIQHGLSSAEAEVFVREVAKRAESLKPERVWMWLARNLLRPSHPFPVHRYLHDAVFADWEPVAGAAPAWIPEYADRNNIAWLMRRVGKDSYRDLHAWSVSQRDAFWAAMVERLDVCFKTPPWAALDESDGPEHPRWLPGAELNVVDSCFRAPDDSPAIVFRTHDGVMRTTSVAELRALVARVANGLVGLGLAPGDRVAIDMPMTVESVAIFLGLVAAGCVVVTVADSFAPDEISARLRIGEAKCIFTQDYGQRLGKKLPLYEKVQAAGAPKAVVLPCQQSLGCKLRDGDLAWHDFLSNNTELTTVGCTPDQFSTILFSSGTTGTPKAIPWNQTTPLKAAIDAHLHHDIRHGDVVCWPTNLGWMMGPWLVYASLMNRATIALSYGAPTTAEFARFVQDARVTMLGLVPSLVSAWKDGHCAAGLDWSAIRVFSSTGECSNPEDMLFLMSLAEYKPVIEYCGGTEIGGGYITGTVVQPSAPGTFSTPALGSDMVLLDDEGNVADRGEVFLIPPSMGLSLELLNGDHHEVYHADAPTGPQGQLLRRHGDQMEHLGNGYYRAHGRVDDSMNLGGIKVSSLQIEEAIVSVPGVRETAAIGVSPPQGGPSRLVVCAVPADGAAADTDRWKIEMQQAIRSKINPLFRIHDVVAVDALPRTASHKVMRRTLRAEYEKQMQR